MTNLAKHDGEFKAGMAGRGGRRYRNNTSGYVGVSPHKKTGKWQALIGYRGKQYHIGLFDTPEDAHAAYLSVYDDPFSLNAIMEDFSYVGAHQ